MNLLAIDAGNTRIKWGLHDGHQWLRRGHIAHNEIATLTSIATEIDRVIISNVAGAAITSAIKQAFKGRAIHIVLPLVVQKQAFGLIYADRGCIAAEGVPPDEAALIKTLKAQIMTVLSSR